MNPPRMVRLARVHARSRRWPPFSCRSSQQRVAMRCCAPTCDRLGSDRWCPRTQGGGREEACPRESARQTTNTADDQDVREGAARLRPAIGWPDPSAPTVLASIGLLEVRGGSYLMLVNERLMMDIELPFSRPTGSATQLGRKPPFGALESRDSGITSRAAIV
jgi:hypothetical protein